jgi:hypothetical protein
MVFAFSGIIFCSSHGLDPLDDTLLTVAPLLSAWTLNSVDVTVFSLVVTEDF